MLFFLGSCLFQEKMELDFQGEDDFGDLDDVKELKVWRKEKKEV